MSEVYESPAQVPPRKSRRRTGWTLMQRGHSQLTAVLSLGIVCQLGQVVLLRELMLVFHGNELSLGIVLACWMFWVGVGARIGGRVAERVRSVGAAALISAGVLVVLPVGILLIRALRGFFPVPPGAYLSIGDTVLATVLVSAPIGVPLGLQFVVLAGLWRLRDNTLDTSSAGKAYIAEAAGHALGGLLFTLVIVQFLNSFQTVILAGVLMAATTLALRDTVTTELSTTQFSTAAPVRGPSKAPMKLPLRGATARRVLIAVVVIAAASMPFLGRLDSWAYRMQWEAFSPEHELITVRQSRYGAISVARRNDQLSFFQSGNLMFAAGGRSAPDAGSALGFEEQEAVVAAHFAMVQHPEPKRVLLIGGGARGTLREILRHPVEQVDYVELDPVVTEVAREYLGPETVAALEHKRVRLIHGDGRSFVKSAAGEYDLIIVDVPEPATAVLNRYYTTEFFREAAERLDRGGVLAIGAASTADLRSPAVANRNATIYHTLRSVFPDAIAVGDRHLQYFAARSPDVISADPAALQLRYHERGVQAEGFSPGQFQLLLEEGSLRRVNWTLRRHGRSDTAHLTGPESGPIFPQSLEKQRAQERDLPPVRERYFINSDFRPVGLVHSLAFWNQLTRGRPSPVFRNMLEVTPWWIAPFVALAILAVVALRVLGVAARTRTAHGIATRYAVLLAVFTTGLSTMALQVALLFAFQTIYGFVYEMVGMITAGFMAGLGVGAGAVHHFVSDKSRLTVLMVIQLVIAGCAALIAVGLPAAAQIESARAVLLLFFGLTFLAGALNGVDFPIATECAVRFHHRAERATGVVYGLELFGACSGALIAGIVVAPVLGIAAACLLAAIGNATAFLVLLLSGRNYGAATSKPAL